MFIKKYFSKIVAQAFDDAEKFISTKTLEFTLTSNKKVTIVDVGCGIGDKTIKMLSKLPKHKILDIYGLDILPTEKIIDKTLLYKKLDVEKDKYPFSANSIDIVICNQVIEHLLDKDFLIAEVHRILKKGGLFMLATENIASLDNIVSLVLGQEPVTQVTSSKYRTNSILSTSFMQKELYGNKYEHKNDNSYFGIKRLYKVNGFESTNIKSFGSVCKPLELVLPIYNKVIVVSAVK